MVRIKSVGVELEGGIPYSSIKELQEYERFDFTEDSSVHVEGEDDWVPNAELKYWVPREKIDELYDFIKHAFALGLRQNETCGNHIHLGLNTREDLVLMSFLGFWRYFRKEIRKWRDKRVNERFSNKYCWGVYEDYEGYAKNPTDRYYAINFKAREKHGDELRVEIRLLPHADNSGQLIRWIKDMLRIVEEFPPNKALVLTKREGTIDLGLGGEEIVNLITPFANHFVIKLPNQKRGEIVCVL